MSRIVLYDYWRSSASYRVRIALNLLGIAYEAVSVDIVEGQQKGEQHLERNPQGLVPVLEIDGKRLTQSLAIIEYLNEAHAPPPLLPADPLGRARVRALAYAIAMDIHPICNTGTVNHVMSLTGGGDQVRTAWMQKFIGQGLTAFEKLLDDPSTGQFCHGDQPTMADLCLVPQVYNAERWGVDLTEMPRIREITAECGKIEAFRAAFPRDPAGS